MADTYDVVIIGSGAGGAPIAYELARAGKRVVVFEKGPLLRTQDDIDPARPAAGAVTKLSDFKRDELFNFGPERLITVPGMENTNQAFYGSFLEPDLNDEPHIYTRPDGGGSRVTIEGYTAQVVGGGTQLYGAVSLRFAPSDFRLRSFNQGRSTPLRGDPGGDALANVIDWPFDYGHLEPFYAKAEELVGINGTQQNQLKPFSRSTYQTPLAPNPISEFARQGMERLGMAWYRTPLAVITEDHAPSQRKAGDPKVGYVNRYGDPMGFKSNTWVSLLRPTLRAGFPLEIRANSVVTHLESSGGRVTRVHYRDPGGAPQTVEGTLVVVACSAIESVRLLMLSGMADRPGFGQRVRFEQSGSMLGRFFLTHAFGGAEVVIKGKRYDKSRSLDSDYATDACARDAFLEAEGLWGGAAIYNNTSDQGQPVSLAATHRSSDLDALWMGYMGDSGKRGQSMIDWFDADFGTRLSVSFMANQIPRWENRIELHPYTDKWNRPVAHIIKDWHAHDGYLMEVMHNRCRAILEAGVADADRGDVIESGSVYGNGVRIANHILGGARFAATREQGVLDPDCRVWDFDNLYVTDGCFMPTSGGANPTLTIQANAFRVAELLKQRV
jgi:choline dehydrogenase-like flavoprotein